MELMLTTPLIELMRDVDRIDQVVTSVLASIVQKETISDRPHTPPFSKKRSTIASFEKHTILKEAINDRRLFEEWINLSACLLVCLKQLKKAQI